jgi:hypothetical protein
MSALARTRTKRTAYQPWISRLKGNCRMELQSASPLLVEGLRSAAGIDLPTTVLPEIRPEGSRLAKSSRKVVKLPAEETLVPDQRSELSPAQSVERKLSSMLRSGAAIPVSHFRFAKMCRKG